MSYEAHVTHSSRGISALMSSAHYHHRDDIMLKTHGMNAEHTFTLQYGQYFFYLKKLLRNEHIHTQ